MSEGLGFLRVVDGRLEVEPLDQDAASLVKEAKQTGRKATFRSELPTACPLDPEVPPSISTCAALEDLQAAREGDLDTVDLLDRLITREMLRERWEKGEIGEADLWRLD